MSTFATDPNVHEGRDYETNGELLVALSRNLQEPELRLDVLRVGPLTEAGAFAAGITMSHQEARELAGHILNAVGRDAPWPENRHPSPEELHTHVANRPNDGKVTDMLRGLLLAAREAARCFEQNHEGQSVALASLRRRHQVMVSELETLARDLLASPALEMNTIGKRLARILHENAEADL